MAALLAAAASESLLLLYYSLSDVVRTDRIKAS